MTSARALPLIATLLLSGCNSSTDTTLAVGTLEWERIEVAAQVAEPVIAWNVQEGSRVSTGQPLLQLATDRLQARANAAAATRTQAEARLAELESGTRPERLAQAQAQLSGSEAALQYQTGELARLDTLLERKLTAPDRVAAARAAVAAARASRDSAQAIFDELTHGATTEELAQARAAMLAAEATANVAASDLAQTVVTAPVAGRLDELPFKVGERPPVGGVVAVILAGDRPYARVYVPEALHARLRPGNTATIHIDGIEKGYTGTLRKISADPSFTPYFALTEHDRGRLSFVAEVDVDAGGSELPAGTPVQVRFDLDNAKN